MYVLSQVDVGIVRGKPTEGVKSAVRMIGYGNKRWIYFSFSNFKRFDEKG